MTAGKTASPSGDKEINMDSYEINLPYFKQGDDFHHCMENTENVISALTRHANLLRDAAQQLEDIATAVEGKEVSIRGDTHCIFIEGPEELLKDLTKRELISCHEWEDDCEEDEYGEEDGGDENEGTEEQDK
jgi:hypothetical protein